jgi:hypothetical protein
MLCCGANGLEAMIIVTMACVPREQPQIGLWRDKVRLPLPLYRAADFGIAATQEATGLADGLWQSVSELVTEIADQHGRKRDQFTGRIEIGGCLASV